MKKEVMIVTGAGQISMAIARPELKSYLDSVAEYDNIFVVGPNWSIPFRSV